MFAHDCCFWLCSWMTGCCVEFTTRKVQLRSSNQHRHHRVGSTKLNVTKWKTWSRSIRRRIACTSRLPTRCRGCTRRSRAVRSRWCRRSLRARCRASGRGRATASFRIITWMPLSGIIRCRRSRISSCTSPGPSEINTHETARRRSLLCVCMMHFWRACCIAWKHETEWMSVSVSVLVRVDDYYYKKKKNKKEKHSYMNMMNPTVYMI